ncbi:MAG: DUF4124 domain-containing protein [Gammaproteobacteria bacterium]|nr:DUF4124 domain-containing protein [Gammaproteobacteria bacterium]
MLLKSVFYKLAFVLVLLVTWVIYDRWDQITGSYYAATDAVVETADKLGLVPEEEITKTTVYKWTDDQGKVHFSNKAPLEAKNTETKTFNSNANVMDPVKIPRKAPDNAKSNDKPAGTLGNMATAVKDARAARGQMEQRPGQVEEALRQANQ